MNLERKKIIEKIGYAVIVSFIIFVFLASVKFKGTSYSFFVFRSLLNPISIFIGFSCFFGIHIRDFFKDLIKGIKEIKVQELILFLKYVFIYQGIIILTTNLDALQEMSNDSTSSIDLYVSITMILFVLFEEYIFRYIVQRKLMNVSRDYGILVMAIVFGLFHYGKYKSGFLFGIALGIIYAITENISYTVIIHYFLNSTVSMRIAVFCQNLFAVNNIELAQINKTTGFISLLLGFILIIGQFLLNKDFVATFSQREKETLKKVLQEIKYLPELIKAFPLNIGFLFRFFIFLQK
ncbi:MAG: CPBP family intramembrane glutamic endopeptidase [Peptoniphilus lacydonensis]|uniref:CPBP family intramembrane glutamic endopeptidase n=1 Tax=Peptoniphilus lacydonensis TaxID=1673725 RepID=UPI002587387F|nr:CPBP family intramembrane glutamic endopeptidase [Peptoniphilus lacydonensis]MDU1954303.1 CPBP family intramembrane glutamic endopeptidase [Peptoniphilus lacydonensis]MDU2115032.1 CPBP family intramembrane glutamic endopeptidase [Peptoniphilus lacydonensis]MDU5274766.1 CPBP family intramembrane glutamic endopeptidase [Peptoniphilus lacydonensis]MDU7302631.1 CPBP family intramembrane glutamic endopeptidase [Peptoniphilus lacydonensis]